LEVSDYMFSRVFTRHGKTRSGRPAESGSPIRVLSANGNFQYAHDIPGIPANVLVAATSDLKHLLI
jgi:hypothetical protein